MIRSCLLIISIFLYLPIYTQESLLTIVIMIRDEQEVIQPTLKPYLEAGITDYLIYDTGSMDLTIEKTIELFRNYPDATYKIIQEPFIDYATSRNKALDYAEEYFNKSIFYLMPDAEWYFENVNELLQFCWEKKDKDDPSYLIRIWGNGVSFYIPRLIRAHSHSRFSFDIHEQLNPFCAIKAPNHFYFKWSPSDQGVQKTIQRLENDIALLMKDYEKNPHDPHALFFLGKTYECLKDYKNAYRFYGERSRIKTTSSEADFIAIYRLALTSEIMDSETNSTWPVALHYFLRAYGLHPIRIEPLVHIAQHYLMEDNIETAYMFIKQACQMPYPTDDIILIEQDMYDVIRYEIYAVCAFYLGKPQEALKVLQFALQHQPQYSNVNEYLKVLVG